MARSRNIKPGFFRNEHLVELPFQTRLLFIGLWTLADREGRLENRPKKIKLEIFPADDVDIGLEITRLSGAGLVKVYKARGIECIEVLNFKKHQNPHHREAASELPSPEEAEAQPVENKGASESPGQAQGKPEESRADSLNLIPDSGFKDIAGSDDPAPDQTGDLLGDTSTPPTKKPRKPKSAYQLTRLGNGQYLYPDDFNRVWAKYPQRPAGDDKREAFEAFNARVTEGASLQEIEDGVDRYLAYVKANGNLGTDFVKRGKTFFGPSRWFEKPWTITATATPGQQNPRANPGREDRDAEIDRLLAEQGQGVGVTYEHE